MIFIQRTGTTGTVHYAGDKARVLDAQGHVVKDWTTGGTLSGIPQGDGYTLQVQTGSSVKSDALAIGAVVFTIGQSNIERWFDTPTAVPDAASGTYEMQSNGTIGHVQGGASTYFTENYAAAAGVPTLIVDASKGGTALVQSADKGNGYWLDTSAGSLYANALSLLAKVGGSAETVLWAQGETDASANVSTATYANALTTFMNRALADFHSGKILIQEIGPHGAGAIDDGKYGDVRTAQHQVADALAGVDIGAITTDLNTIEDGIHLTGASRVLAADRLLDDALAQQGISYTRSVWNGSNSTSAGDTHAGTDARDELHGLAGDDVLDGAGGSDVILGGDGNDTITGGAGVDLIRGDAGNDTIDGGDDADVISGGAGNDSIKGGAGNDEIWADAGDDTITGGLGNDYIVGGAGTDTAVYLGTRAGYSVTASGSVLTVRDIDPGNGDEGTDTLDGVETVQFADGVYNPNGPGQPGLFTNSADAIDFATVKAGAYDAASLYAALDGNDEVYLPKDAAAAKAAGYDATKAFDAGAGNDVVIGGTLNDWIKGGDGDDILNGGAGADKMEGGIGDDRYYVDNAKDTVTEAANAGLDTVISTITYALKSNVENLTLSPGGSAIDGTGNELDNALTGNDGRNTLKGLAGNDTLSGGGGDDTLVGGLGNDTIDGGAGTDTAVFAGKMASYTITTAADGSITVVDNTAGSANEGTNHLAGVEVLTFSDGTYTGPTGPVSGGLFTEAADTIDFNTVQAGSYAGGSQYFGLGGDDHVTLAGTSAAAATAGYDTTKAFDAGGGNDTVTGGALADWIKGGDGNDTIDGRAGADKMEGGAGDDTYLVDNAKDTAVEAVGGGTDTVIASVKFTLKGNVENLTLTGTGALSGTGNELDNVIAGNDGKNSLKGYAGNDTISGGGGDDTIEGGAGQDTLTGGAGNDKFVFRAASDVGGGATGLPSDTITDFAHGDRIDLSKIDAVAATTSDDKFGWIGTAAFSHKAGELHATADAANGQTLVSGDVDGDGAADFQLVLKGMIALAASDFSL